LPGLTIGIAYATVVLVQWLLPRRASAASNDGVLTRRRWALTIGLDLVTFTLLNVVGAATTAHSAFFVLPVLMAGVLASRVGALAVAAAASIVLLAIASTQAATGSESWLLITQAGIVGGGLFLVALVAHELAARLAREEAAARSTLAVARQQAELNRLVIDEMQEGVMVVDRRGRARVANPVARTLLRAVAPPGASFPLRGVAPWQPLVAAVEQAFLQGGWPAAGRDVKLQLPDGERVVDTVLRVRMRFTQRRQARASEDLCVLFVEDVRSVQARTRQEKLAAMGRVSAGIAHEIRNPLAAISQANALLGEDVHDAAHRRLIQMVADNAERLRRIVEDVLEVAPSERGVAGVIDLTTLVGSVLGEWARTAGVALDDHGPLHYDLGDQAIGVRFDPDHLRRVLVNLLDNGLRHSSGGPAAVSVTIELQGPQGVRLAVASDGAPIGPDVEPYLFEPFYSTRSRGTGLGLYICRELCERYGATIDYRQQDASHRHRNVFAMVMQRHELPHSEPRLSLSA
jgi:two-component system, NtrC family, sensor histidine kinase PilS